MDGGFSTIPGQLLETVSAASWTAALDSFPVFTCFEIGGPIPSPEGRAHHDWESFLRMLEGGNNVTGCRWVSFPTYSQVVVSRPPSLISRRRRSVPPMLSDDSLSLFRHTPHFHLSHSTLSHRRFSLYLPHLCLFVQSALAQDSLSPCGVGRKDWPWFIGWPSID